MGNTSSSSSSASSTTSALTSATEAVQKRARDGDEDTFVDAGADGALRGDEGEIKPKRQRTGPARRGLSSTSHEEEKGVEAANTTHPTSAKPDAENEQVIRRDLSDGQVSAKREDTRKESESINAASRNQDEQAKNDAETEKEDGKSGDEKKKEIADKKQGNKNTEKKEKTKKKKKKKKKKKLNLNFLDQEGDEERSWPTRLLVLDVNGVLVARSRAKIAGLAENYRDPLGFHVYDRPHMRELLHWARHKRGYELALWTSASAPVAQGVAKHIFAAPKFHLQHDCVMVLDQTACGRKGRTDRNTPNFVKPLERIWLNPKYENVYTSANTLILDNEESKTALNAENAVRVTTFDPSQENAESGLGDEDEDEDFGEGGALWRFLDAMARQPDVDVQKFMKSSPIDSFRGMN